MSIQPSISLSIHFLYLIRHSWEAAFQPKEEWVDSEMDAVGLNKGRTACCPVWSTLSACTSGASELWEVS